MRIERYLFGVLALILGSGSVRADVSSWTASGSGKDGALSASATFSTANGVLTVTLTDTLAANVFRSQGQALSDISFTVSNPVTSVGTMTAAGQFGDVDGSGNVAYVKQDNTHDKTYHGLTSPTRWISNGTLTGTSLSLEAIDSGKPSEMIAPQMTDGGRYVNAENGMQQMNSYVIGSATFTLHLTGINANTTVSDVKFSFGTGPDTYLTGIHAPEPSTMLVAAFGAFGFLGYGLRRRKAG